MKKLLRNIAILLTPMVAWLALFVAFEPNNYFGLKPKADGTDIIAALRGYQRRPQNFVILGDSRLAKFDENTVREVTGHSYANLAYGGAALKEQLDILDWALVQNPKLTEVVFMLSFYTLNEHYNHDRQVIRALSNPFAYVTNLGYNINMVTNLVNHLTPGAAVGDAAEHMDASQYVYTAWTHPDTGETYQLRQAMLSHLPNVVERSRGWALDEALLQRLLQTIQACRARGVRFVVVLPPASPQVYPAVIDAFGIGPKMGPALAALGQSGAVVLDYEFAHTGLLQDAQFYDCFHVDLKSGMPFWTRKLFGDVAAGWFVPYEE